MKFKVQGQQFSKSDLELWCWDNLTYVQPWERSHLLFILQWLSRAKTIDVRTSGTTGDPKRISLPKEMMTESALITKEALKIPDGASVIVALPSQFIAGKMMLVRALVNHFEIRWIRPSANPFAEIKKAPHFMALTPMQVKNALNHHSEIFEQLGIALLGGQAVDSQLEQQLASSNVKCYESYGMTETSSHVAIRAVNGPDKTTWFQALPGYRFDKDERGCLIVFQDTWFPDGLITNDQIEFLSPSTFKLLGRLDYVINSGGVKVHPERIEEKIRPLLGEMRFMIHKEADSASGERVILYLEKGQQLSTSGEVLMKSMGEVLSSIETPKSVYFIEQFEETSTSKMIRKPYQIVERLI